MGDLRPGINERLVTAEVPRSLDGPYPVLVDRGLLDSAAAHEVLAQRALKHQPAWTNGVVRALAAASNELPAKSE